MTENTDNSIKKRAKILIADDEVLFLNMLAEILKRGGYESDTVSSGDAAINMIENNSYDVVLSDIRMPGATGLEVLNHAKEKDADTQVIMISAFGDTENILKALRLGASDFIQKPVEIPAIIPNIVARAAEKRELVLRNRQLFEDLQARTSDLENALSTIKNQQEQLVHAERLKVLGTMAAGMAHEINNPLAFISTNVQTLEKYVAKVSDELLRLGGDADFVEWANKGFTGILGGVHKGVLRISQITMALRTFSRKGSGVMQEVLLNNCVEDALRIIAPRLTNIKLNLDLCDTRETISGNEQNLVHAIMNFVQNACDAMEESERKELDIKTMVTDKEQILFVRDTGIGIPDADRQKIFELFYTTKPVGKGTGLGLSIALGVIEESGGLIGIDSEPGKGTEITVTWPKHKGVDVAESI